MKNYYSILGVSKDAPIVVISAAYRALAKLYHPDVWTGASEIAEKTIRELNEAYAVLSDPKQKKEYDEKFERDVSEATSDFSGQDEVFGDFGTKIDDWGVVEEYYPGIEVQRKELNKIDHNLAVLFQFLITEEKIFDEYLECAAALKSAFFTKFFGSNLQVHTFAEALLMDGKRKIAQELNKSIRVLGTDQASKVVQKIKTKYAGELEGSLHIEREKWLGALEKFLGSFNFKEKDRFEFVFSSTEDGIVLLNRVKVEKGLLSTNIERTEALKLELNSFNYSVSIFSHDNLVASDDFLDFPSAKNLIEQAIIKTIGKIWR